MRRDYRRLRIATFNVNSIRSRLDVVLAWLEEHRPDILCLQETKAQDHDFPAAPLEAAGYHAAFRGEKAYNGVAILSRLRPQAVTFGLPGRGPADEVRLAHARLGRLHVINTYVPQGREIASAHFRYKLEWFHRLRQYFDRQFKAGDWVLWAGDLNVAREPQDVHHPELYANHVCFHQAVRAAFEDCLAWGFADVFRRFHPGPGHYTFYDYRTPRAVERGLGWRLDYLLASAPLARCARAAFIDLAPRRGSRPSDHAPVAADFACKKVLETD